MIGDDYSRLTPLRDPATRDNCMKQTAILYDQTTFSGRNAQYRSPAPSKWSTNPIFTLTNEIFSRQPTFSRSFGPSLGVPLNQFFFYRAFVPIKKPRHFKRDPAAGHLVGIMGDLPRPCKHGQLKKWASVHEEPLISSVVGSLTRATCCSSNSLAFLVRITGSMDVLGGGHSKLFAAGGIV